MGGTPFQLGIRDERGASPLLTRCGRDTIIGRANMRAQGEVVINPMRSQRTTFRRAEVVHRSEWL